MSAEASRPVHCPSFPRYYASADGSLYVMRDGALRAIKSHPDAAGYMVCVVINCDGRRNKRVHQLVADAFYGPIPAGHEIDHIDCNKANNTPENLRYVTRAENMRLAAMQGRFPSRKGIPRPVYRPRNPNKPKDPNRVRPEPSELLSMHKGGMTYRQIAERVGYSKQWVTNILREVYAEMGGKRTLRRVEVAA